ncbi:MAG: efflux RND transporter permease subunit [Chitinophagaceae bacterium]|nr:efflux RND transporter permease subunit [Chitinophagaceae bacterium]
MASSITNVVVFIPLLFASSDFKANFIDLATAVSICVFIAYFLSLIFVPMLALIVLKEKSLGPDLKFFDKFFSLNKAKNSFEKLTQAYHISKNHRRIILYSLILFGLISIFFVKKEYIDFQGGREISASVELPTGTSLEVTSRITKKVESLIQQVSGVEKVSSKVEKWHSDLTIKLKNDVNDINEVRSNLRKATESLEDAFVYYHDANSNSSSKEIDLDFVGDELSQLKDIAKEIAEKIREIPETDQVIFRFREGKKEFNLNLDREKISLSGLSNQVVSDYARTALQGSIPTKIFDNDKEVDIRVRFLANDRLNVDSIRYSYLPTSKSNVSLRDMVQIEKGVSDTRINRKNKRRMVTITASFKNGSLADYANKIEKKLLEYPFPTNYYYEFGESVLRLRKSQLEMIGFIMFAILLTYSVLSILFQSLTLSLIVMIMVPVNLLITTFFLFLFGQTYNISTYIGFILLSGLSINNSIMLLENFLNVEDSSLSMDSRIEIAKNNRRRAMQMTTLTTIIALLPGIVLSSEGSEFWRPMSFAVVIGMTVSYITAMELFPDFLKFQENLKQKAIRSKVDHQLKS